MNPSGVQLINQNIVLVLIHSVLPFADRWLIVKALVEQRSRDVRGSSVDVNINVANRKCYPVHASPEMFVRTFWRTTVCLRLLVLGCYDFRLVG
jgi:hypothetical protein